MTHPHDQEPDDPRRERLVAYLDGELPEGESLGVESQLSQDEPLRRELRGLERAWNALDELPRYEAGESFARTTIEMAVVEAQRELESRTTQVPLARRRARLGLALVGAAAALVGFAASWVVATAPDRALVRSLPVVWQAEALKQAPEIEFLRKLSEEAPRLVAQNRTKEVEADAKSWGWLEGASSRERSRWVRELDENEKARLLNAAGQYAAQTPEGRALLDARHAELTAAPDAESLRVTALAYNRWLGETLTPAQRAELRQAPTVDARLQLAEALHRQQTSLAGRQLTAADTAALRDAVRRLAGEDEVRRLTDAVLERLEQMTRRWEAGGQGPADGRAMERLRHNLSRLADAQKDFPIGSVLVLAQLNAGRGHPFQWLFRDDWDDVERQARADWDHVERELVSGLGDTSKQFCKRISSRRERAETLSRWLVESARVGVDDQELERFFATNRVTDAERNELLAYSDAEMKQRLRELYIQRELGGFDPNQFQEFGWPRERGRGGPGFGFRGPGRGGPGGPPPPGGPPLDAPPPPAGGPR